MYVPINEVGALQLGSELEPHHVGVDVAYIGALAARRGLGTFYLTEADSWPGVPELLADPVYTDNESSEPGWLDRQIAKLRPAQSFPLTPEEIEREEAADLAREMDDLVRGKTSSLAEVRVMHPHFRFSHDRPPFAIGIDRMAFDVAYANRADELKSAGHTRPPAEIASDILNKALLAGLREATTIQYMSRIPKGELRAFAALHIPQLMGTALLAAEGNYAAAGITLAATTVLQNVVRAYMAHREGANLRDFCWSVLPALHPEHLIVHQLPVRPLAKAI